MKAAIYCRVSTEEQATGGHSIEAQKQELLKYCEALNYEVYDFYIDAGYSASTLERPELQRLLRECGKFNMVLVWRLDRLSRDMSDLMKILEIFQNNDVSFKSKTENFDTSTPSGKLMLNMLGSFAEFERESIRERIKLAHKKILQEGKWRGGRAPLGYRIDENKRLIIDEREAEIIKKIFYMSAIENIGTRSIAEKLNELGYKTRNNMPFTSSYISRILKNPTYAGELIHGRQCTVKVKGKKKTIYNKDFNTYSGNHEAIVSREIFDKAQINMEKRKKNRSLSNSIPNIFSGLIFCGDCHAPMLRSQRRDGYGFFLCKGYKDKGTCSHHYISENILISAIITALEKMKYDERDLLQLKEHIKNMKENKINEIKKEIAVLERQLVEYKAREEILYELVEKSIITSEIFLHRQNKLTSDREIKMKRLSELRNYLAHFEKNKELIITRGNIQEDFESLSDKGKKDFLKALIERIEVFNNKKPYDKKVIHIYFKV